MSELKKQRNELSTDLSTITAEINAYQRVAGEAIFEIGRRLYHVKYNPKEYGLPEGTDKHGNTIVARGVWGEWLAEINIDNNMATRFMKIVEELGEGKSWTSTNRLGMDALYQIATLPPEERDIPHELPTGETKKPDEMTVRELRELKRQLKETERQAEAERKERERLEQENEELSSREPEVRVEYVEKESEEPYNRMYDRPFDVERTNDFYEMMNEVDELYRKYAHLKDSIEEIGAIAKYDDDLKKRYKQAQDLWVMLDSIFNNNNDEIIDVEII